MKTIFRSFILTVLFGAMSSAALAEKMNSETQNMVIERLEQIIKDMGAHDSSLNPSRLRLADLLAERARLRFMNEIEVSCKGCKGSVADREKALKLYQSVFPHFQAQIQGVILFQMAHLYDIAGQGQKAANLYLGILKNPKKYSPEMITATRSALADLYFQQGNYKQSLYLYNLVSRDPKADQKALVQYRIAWCHFNLGALKTAIRTLEKLANKPELMTKNTTAGVVLDDGFRQDVLQDLATFYSRRAVTDQDITSFQRLTPDAIKKVMLLNFAQEVDRLGQKQAAAKIYHIYLDRKDLF
jgi:tetratricopeptide (TPR) repeat protein